MDGVAAGDDALIAAKADVEIPMAVTPDSGAAEDTLILHGLPEGGERLMLREERAYALW